MGVPGIAELLGVSRQRADELSRRKDFPEPIGFMGRQRIWNEVAVRKWAEKNGREVKS